MGLFSRMGNLVKGFLSLFVSGIERRSPEALLEVEKENLRTQIARYNDGLASHAGLCERLMTQIARVMGINQLEAITPDVVHAARQILVIGAQ